jgi:hypothetical protein
MFVCWWMLPSLAYAQIDGVKLVGRWLPPPTDGSRGGGPVATYAGSTVLLRFKHSPDVYADLKVMASKGSQELFISVTVDGGKPTRMGLARGVHESVVLASGLSDGNHVVAMKKEGEPGFGALQFSNPRLDVAGRWLPIHDDRPIVEVIGDSDATGICALGPDSPADATSIWTSSWASESYSWVGVLDAELASLGHPVDMVDLALSGSKTASEADSYDYTAPDYSDAHFGEYAQPGRKNASVVFLWGGGNDHHGGGDLAHGAVVTRDTLSTFEKGIFTQLTKVFTRNPGVRVVLLEYTDPTIPSWKTAYEQVESLLPEEQQKRIFYLRVYDPKGKQDACEIDPEGHPNLALHMAWAGQILAWLLTTNAFHELGFPDGEQWYDE